LFYFCSFGWALWQGYGINVVLRLRTSHLCRRYCGEVPFTPLAGPEVKQREQNRKTGGIGRRGVLRYTAALGLGSAGLGATADMPAARADSLTVPSEWRIFRDRFVTSDGRVVDTGNGGISHSEGQGWGMLFAEAAGDKERFDLIFAWTSTHLARPVDALHIWRYDPNAALPTSDPNNATDGDIFIAWALARAARRWQEPAFSIAGAAIATDILNRLCVQQSGQFYLLPGIQGFASAKNFNLNPSYYVFPAFGALAQLAPSPDWDMLRANGLSTLQSALFGSWGLPPDWLAVSRPGLELAPAAGWPPRFSYDAIRVPLWLTWADVMPPVMGKNFLRFWQSSAFPYRPAWINLEDGAFADYPAPSGMSAIASLTMAAQAGTAPQLPSVADAPDYYSAALTLLSRMAASEMAGAE
jgi:endoglucanase